MPDKVGPDTHRQTFLRGISTKAGACATHRFENLYGCVNESLLKRSWRLSNKKACSGVDGVTAAQYAKDLATNIHRLVSRLKSNQYRARLIRRHYIPKGNGKRRPLGIPVLEDRLLQGAAKQLLEAIYEQDFLPNSFGYRPGVSARDAVRALTFNLQYGRFGYVVEADIQGFFDHINHDWLLEMLRERIHDKPFLGLIEKWLKSGILETDGQVIHPQTGTPQGGVVSPVLANIYLHYVLDLWFEKVVKRHCKGKALLIRYADDFVCAFQYRTDAERFRRGLGKRLGKFSLALAPDKTRIHRFSRFHPSRRKRFNFLGFEFYWEVDRKGTARLKKRTSRKRLHTSVRAFKEWLKTHRHVPRQQLLAVVRSKLVGYYNYFGMIGNSRSLWTFYRHVEKLLYKWLNRRSQRRSLTRGKLCSVLKYFRIPEPRITERTGVLNPVLA
jgi:group II intron reverse transcriptase/maturase